MQLAKVFPYLLEFELAILRVVGEGVMRHKYPSLSFSAEMAGDALGELDDEVVGAFFDFVGPLQPRRRRRRWRRRQRGRFQLARAFDVFFFLFLDVFIVLLAG